MLGVAKLYVYIFIALLPLAIALFPFPYRFETVPDLSTYSKYFTMASDTKANPDAAFDPKE